jgi:hypothetical protein
MKKTSKKPKRTAKRGQKKQSVLANGPHEKRGAGGPEMPASRSDIPVSESAHKKAAISEYEFLLPEPAELAKLAAILGPKLQPGAALKVAMQFYVEAVLFCREHSSEPFEELFTAFASEGTQRAQRIRSLGQELKAIGEDTLELDPQKRGADADTVRKFLDECGLSLKTPRAVLDSIRRYWNQPLPKEVAIYEQGKEGKVNISWAYQRLSFQEMIASCEHDRNGKKTYKLPKSLLESVANFAQRSRKEQKRRSWHTRKAARKTDKQKIRKTSVQRAG